MRGILLMNTIFRGNLLQKGYSAQWLDELKRKSDIVNVVSKYVRLEQKGRKYWGCCPFHTEKTPSFCVDPEGFYHCFGCKEGGDVIRFVEKMESCDFMDAVKILAENCHMELPELSGVDDQVIKKKKEKDRVIKVLDCAYKHYQSNLYLDSAKKAQEYIKSRGFTRRELEDFKIGYSNSWTDLVSHLKKQGFSYEEMLLAGLIAKKEGSSNYYDVMGGRLIFPIFNSFNECIGFSARILEKSDYAKYKNTAETIVFQKNRVVFGINLLKKLKQSGGLSQIILVEGQIDVIAMHRAGFRSTVACMGTALTENHAKELKKLCDNVLICFDGDSAGVKATLRSIDILKNAGLNIKIVCLPSGKDPDEVLKSEGKDGLENYINNALPVMDYLIKTEMEKYDLAKSDEKGKFVKEVLNHLAKLEDASSQEPYLDKIRDLTNIPVEVLRRDLTGKSGAVKQEAKKQENVLIVRENGNIKAEKFILASILYKKDYLNPKINYKKLLPNRNDILEIVESGKSVSSIFDEFDVDNNPLLQDVIYFNFEEFEGIEKKYFQECVWSIAEGILKEKQQEISKKFSEERDVEERRKIMLWLQNISKKLKEKNLEDFYG